MTHIEFSGSALRAWNRAKKLSKSNRGKLLDVWLFIQELELRGELASLRVGEQNVLRMRNPRLNIYIRRTQMTEILILRIAVPT